MGRTAFAGRASGRSPLLQGKKKNPRRMPRARVNTERNKSGRLTARADLSRAQKAQQSQTTPQRSGEGNCGGRRWTNRPLFEAGVAGVGEAEFRIQVNIRAGLASEEAVLHISKHVARAPAGSLRVIHANELVAMGTGIEGVYLCGARRSKRHGGPVETAEIPRACTEHLELVHRQETTS